MNAANYIRRLIMNKMTYREMLGAQDPARIAAHILAVLMSVFLLVRFVTVLVTGEDPDGRMLSYLAVAVLALLPYLFELISRRRLTTFVLLLYTVYLFVAGFWGGCMCVYERVPGTDKVVHTLFGYVACIIGLFVVCGMNDYSGLSPVFVAITCFAVSLALAACWELVEFAGDAFLNGTYQGDYVETAAGTFVQPKNDTMTDILVHFIGSAVFELHYILHRLTRKNLGMGYMINDFSSYRGVPASAPERPSGINAN